MTKDEEIQKLKLEIKKLRKTISSYEKVYNISKADTVKHKFEGIFEGKKILIAEDISVSREIIVKMLEITKVKIDIAENGAEAVEKFTKSSGNYDMILMDIQMPVTDGYTATEKIRKLPIEQAKTIPIIAMSINVSQEDIEKHKNIGINSYVSKPINRDNLINKMAQYFG